MATLKRDLWTAELVNKFRHDKDYLRVVPRRDDLVEADNIHWANIGADPAVLINNTTYPIDAAARTDTDAYISLDKFQTKVTTISDDELYALPYDKPGSVIRQHREVLEDKTAEYGLWQLASEKTTANVESLILTTGDSNGATKARKRLTITDVITAKKFMDTLDVPRHGRTLVLCPDHVEDLLLVSEAFEKQYQNIREGEVLRLYGFDVFEFSKTPIYAVASSVLKRNAFGAAAAPDTDQVGSPFFWAPNTMRALGTVKMYYQLAETSPTTQAGGINFRLMHKVLAKSRVGFGALVAAIHA